MRLNVLTFSTITYKDEKSRKYDRVGYRTFFHFTFFVDLASWSVTTSGESVMRIDPSLRK